MCSSLCIALQKQAEPDEPTLSALMLALVLAGKEEADGRERERKKSKIQIMDRERGENDVVVNSHLQLF